MGLGVHPAAQNEYIGAIRWMASHHYDPKAFRDFIEEIETGLVVIETRGTELALDPCGRPGWRFYEPTKKFHYVIRFIEHVRGEPYIMAINAPQRPGYWKSRRVRV